MEIKKVLKKTDHPFLAQHVEALEVEFNLEDHETLEVAVKRFMASVHAADDPKRPLRSMADEALAVLLDSVKAENPQHGPFYSAADLKLYSWEEGSPPWYAERILDQISQLHKILGSENADPWRVANLALHIGALHQEAQLSAVLEAPARSGMKTKAGGKKGAERAHGNTSELYRDYVASFEALRAKGRGKMGAYKEAGEAHGVSYKTIANAVRKK